MPIKRQVFTSLVRAIMEYASAVWFCNSKQERKLESLQHTGAVWMLRVNSRSNQTALRTILKLPRLKSRRTMLRLFYVATLLRKPHATWARHCLETPPSETCKIRGISQSHWDSMRAELISDSSILGVAYKNLTSYLPGGGGVLPGIFPLN